MTYIMALLEILAQFVTSILIAYLAFTNVLAGRIETLLPESIKTETDVVQEEISLEEKPLESFSQNPIESSRDWTIPKILLESSEYQQAALGASQGNYPLAVLDESIPLSEQIIDSLVNIFCQLKTKDYVRTTTGTGFFVSQGGVILTNAHVAQFLLLKEVDPEVIDAQCVVRAGNPASPKYQAELLYIPPAWIFENAKLISEEMPRGTGERDYALLYISKGLNDEPLPTRFPSLPVNTDLIPRSTSGIQVLTAGYPAEALFRDGVNAKLIPRVASTTVGELYTFGSNYADIFAVSNSPVGEHGVSGGPIVKSDGNTIGLIVTKGNEETEGANSLRALTLSYINRTIIDETGYSLYANLQGDVAYRGGIFKIALVPFLSKLLSSELAETKQR